jgi:hypothetical protein
MITDVHFCRHDYFLNFNFIRNIAISHANAQH